MFPKLSNKLVDILIGNKTIDPNERELYYYGLNQGLTIILNIITALLIGVILNCFIEIILFMSAYIPLRSYAGGFHANTHLKCYLSSTILLCFIFLLPKVYSFSIFALDIITIVSVCFIIALAPVEDKNKPLDKIEKRLYRTTTLVILIIEIIICILFQLLFKEYSMVIPFVFITEASLLVIGYVKNILDK